MRVWIIRHGMTRLGEEKRYQGKLDDGLSELGRTSLRTADIHPERVYVSSARRAIESAEILFPESRKLVFGDLREMDFGRFEGRGWWEMEEDLDYRSWVDGGCIGRCPGGEDRGEFSARVCAAFDRIVEAECREESPETEIVIVAHGGTQMALLEGRGYPKREFYRWQRPCGCGWLLEAENAGRNLRVIREISFLK